MPQCKDIADRMVLAEAKRIGGNFTEFGSLLGAVVEKTGFPVKLCAAKIMRLVDRDLLEYGTSVRCAWLTEKGEEALHKEQSNAR